jgi:hypothetical protein
VTGKSRKLSNLKEIEGKTSPHQEQVSRALKLRSDALAFVADVEGLAEFMGGSVEKLGLKEDWAVSKEIFPGIVIYFLFNRADEEFPAALRVLFSGDKLSLISGEDLAGFTINFVSHMLRYVRETNEGKQLPEVCYRV